MRATAPHETGIGRITKYKIGERVTCSRRPGKVGTVITRRVFAGDGSMHYIIDWDGGGAGIEPHVLLHGVRR